jgi:predicted phosphate transport protein (TIGR00153 family)
VRLIPKDEGFFPMFDQLADRLTKSAALLQELFAKPAESPRLVAEIKKVEHEADMLTHEIIVRIDKSFVTPIDREDIHRLANVLDNCIDLIDGTARRVEMFNVSDSKAPARELCRVLVQASKEIEEAVTQLKKPALVSAQASKIKVLEEEGDAIYHEAVGALFRTAAADPIELIKWKELYDTLERALDECEDVGNVLESISLKNS